MTNLYSIEMQYRDESIELIDKLGITINIDFSPGKIHLFLQLHQSESHGLAKVTVFTVIKGETDSVFSGH